MTSSDDKAIPYRLLAILLRLAPRPIRHAVVGALLLLIVVAVAKVVIDHVAGDDPTAQRFATRLSMSLMILASLVVTTCVGVYIRHVLTASADPDDHDEI